MATANSLRGVQKLKVVRTPDGQVDGYLQCSVFLDFGKQRLTFEDSVPGVPVSYVLNPQDGVFLADEVQRLMRIGIGSWLKIELRPERAVDCRRLVDSDDWSVLFRLPQLNEDDCALHVLVAAASERDAVAMALEHAANWVEGLDRRPLDEDLVDLFAELDLNNAPRLSCGLAQVESVNPSSTNS